MAGSVQANSFLGGTDFESGRQRSLWVCVYTIAVIWMVLLLILYLVDGKRKRPTSTMAGSRGAEDVATMEAYHKQNSKADKFRRASRAARLTFLMVFSSTVFTALGYGPTGATIALVWIVFAIGVTWAVAEIFVDSHWLRFVMSLMMFPLVLINYGLAFSSRVE